MARLLAFVYPLFILFFAFPCIQSQLRRNLGTSVIVVLPDGIIPNSTNSLSVAVNNDGEVHVRVFDGSVLLQHMMKSCVPGSPSKLTVGPFLVNPSSFILRVDVKSMNGVIMYANTFHLPKVAGTVETYLETDKPIYRPLKTVSYRILSLTSSYQVHKAPVTILIKNPDQLIIWKEVLYSSDAKPFVKGSFTLPQHLSEGRWTISVKDQSTDSVLSEKHFDVLHYDLPKFELLAVANTSFYVTGNENVNVLVLASLATGHQVSGTLLLTCLSDSGREVIIRSSQLQNGSTNISFSIRQCWFPMSNQPPSSIQVRAELRDYASGAKHFSTVRLARHSRRYVIRLLPLRPGLVIGRGNWNFSAPCLMTVSEPTGKPAGQVDVQTTVDCIQQRNRVERLYNAVSIGKTNENGEILFPFFFRRHCSALMIKVSTNQETLPTDQQITTSLLLPVLVADSNSAMALDTFEAKVGETMNIKIHVSDFTTGITRRILVLSESDILHHFAITDPTVRLSIRSEMIPEFVLVLYQVSNYSSSAIVEDVIRIFASYHCGNEDASLRVGNGQSVHHPGSNVTIVFSGRKGSFVAAKAIDRKLRQIVHQIRPLEQVRYRDSKRKDTLKRLFQYQTMDGFDFEQRKNKTVEICCSAGRVWWQLNADCADLPPTRFPYLEDCRRSFVSCCSGTELPRADPACQRGLNCRIPLSSAEFPSFIMPRLYTPESAPFPSDIYEEEADVDAGISERSYFPEVWLFEEYSFGDRSRLEKQVSLPHSVTNWTITGQFWLGPNAPMCQAQTEVSIDLSIYMEVDLPSTLFVGDQLLAKVIVYNFRNYAKQVFVNVTKPRGLCTANSATDWNLGLAVNSTGTISVPVECLSNGAHEIVFTLYELVGHNRHQQLDRVVKVVHALERDAIDSSLDYNFSWDLSSGDSVDKWINDSILAYNFVRVKNSTSAQISASLYLTEEAVSRLKIDKLIARFTPLPAAKRARWSKLRLPNDTWQKLVTASTLNEILIRAPSILQAVEDGKETEATVPNPVLVQSTQLLHLCVMETLRFRSRDGAYSQYRVPDTRVSGDTTHGSLWLTVLATALHCRTGADSTVVCPSLIYMMQQQKWDGSYESSDSPEFTSLNNPKDNKVILTSFVILTLRVCSDFGIKCWQTDEGKQQVPTLTRSLGYLANVDAKRSDPFVLGSITLAFAAWKHPFARPVNDALLKLLEDGSDYPYWTYKPQLGGFLDKMKHGTKGWFSTEYRRKMLSIQLSLNAMGLLAQITLGNPVNLNLEQIGQWIIEHRKRDGAFVRTLDTILASRALIELHRSMAQSQSNAITRISVQCDNGDECPSVSITPQNAEMTQIMNLNVDSRELTFLVSGRGAVYVKIQLIGKPPLRDPNFYPVQMLANTSADSGISFSHELCLRTSDKAMNSLVIEHTVSTALTYIDHSFSQTKGSARVLSVEPTSHSVHVLYSDIRMNEDQCYTFSTEKRGALYSLRRPIVARHPSLGIVGMAVSAGQNQGSQVPLLEKYCPPNSTECFCAEALCPPPAGECGSTICSDGHVTSLLRTLCNSEYTGCLVKVNSIEEEKVGRSVYKRIVTSKHLPLNPNPSEDECKDIDLLLRKSCQCPSILKEYIYVVVTRKDALLETTMSNFRPTVLLGEHGFFEPFFACSPKRHSDIHKFAEENQRRAICASLN